MTTTRAQEETVRDTTGTRDWHRGTLAMPVIVLSVVWAIVFGPQLLMGRVFVAGDAPAYRPYSEFSRERWQESHERTFWNPYVFTGMPASPSLADSRPQYLPGSLLTAFDALHRNRLWPPLGAVMLSHLAGMLAMAALARLLWGASSLAMIWAGASWGLMPNLVVPLAFGHDAQFLSASLMPVVLLGVHSVFAARSERWPIAALALAATLAIQVLAGHPQIAAYSGGLALLFACERAWHFRRPGRLLAAGSAAVLGAAMAAPVWWPALLYSQHSVRGIEHGGFAVSELTQFSLAARDLLAMVWPWGVGFGGTTYWGGMRVTDYPQYLGAASLLLALLAIPRRTERESSAAWVLAGSAALALVFALGPVWQNSYALLHERIPLIGMFRVAVAGLIVVQVAIALLSARGLDGIVRAWRAHGMPPSHRTTLGVLVGVGLLAAGLIWGPFRQSFENLVMACRSDLGSDAAATAARMAAQDLALRAMLLAAMAAALVVHARAGRAALGGAAGLACLMLLDLGSVGIPILRANTGTIDALDAPPQPAIAVLVSEDSLYRALFLREPEFYSNHWVAWRARSLSGLHGAVNRSWNDLRMAGFTESYPALCAFSVRYLAADSAGTLDSSLFELLPTPPSDARVWRLRGALPRAYAVPRVVALGSDADVLSAVMAGDFIPPQQALTTDVAIAGEYPGSRDCQLRWLEDSADRIALEVLATGPTFLVVADAFFPGWQAALDGVPIPIHRANYLVRGVRMPEGRHLLQMVYAPPGWHAGRWLGGIAAGMWLALAGVALVRGMKPVRSSA